MESKIMPVKHLSPKKTDYLRIKCKQRPYVWSFKEPNIRDGLFWARVLKRNTNMNFVATYHFFTTFSKTKSKAKRSAYHLFATYFWGEAASFSWLHPTMRCPKTVLQKMECSKYNQLFTNWKNKSALMTLPLHFPVVKPLAASQVTRAGEVFIAGDRRRERIVWAVKWNTRASFCAGWMRREKGKIHAIFCFNVK